ncbi:MAG TPA: hypothetical protein VMU39_18470 [Solirubrobacteraceae bacterium]|nr:hypothetical protein [Solirubrobacteraceae bacterium]
MARIDVNARLIRYGVTRRWDGAGVDRIALVREAPRSDHRPSAAERDHVVLAQRTFSARREMFELEAYAAQLERAAEHGNRGTLGSFVAIEPSADGTVSVTLYERWFNGGHLLCERLASRRFAADHDGALVASAEYLVVLQDRAAQRNHRREAAAGDTRADDATAAHQPDDPMTAAARLAQLLKRL